MFEVALINMPFGAVHTPSLGLTQLRAAIARELGDIARADIFYLNHDFSQFFGLGLYRYLADDSRTTVTGFTDWLFRQEAFPDSTDTLSRYVARYQPAMMCRCDGGARRELEACSAERGECGTVAAPCCLEPDVLGEVLRKRVILGQYMDELIERYHLADYPLVGFTSMFDQTVASIAMARRLKAHNPEITTVMGGASCEPGVGRIFARRVDAIDFVFAGPALRSFPEFVGHMARREPEKCHQIPGVYTHGRDNNHGAVGEEMDINSRLSLDYDDFLSSVNSKCPGVVPELFFETSRGCWWGERAHCTFCGINGTTMTFRAMSAENAIAQFSELFEKYPNVQRFTAVDNILEPSYYSTVFPFVKAPEGATIFYETRVIEDDEQMRVLARAGVIRIQPGIEALSTSVLKLMRKGTTAFRNLTFLKKIAAHGIEVEWNLVTGFPNESSDVYDQYLRTIPSFVHLPAPFATFPVRFDRHSPYQRKPGEFGLRLRPLDFYSLVYPFPDEELDEIAYFWADHEFSNTYLFNVARWQRKIEAAVMYWRARWYQQDRMLKPELRLAANGRAIYDSRSGDVVQHPLSPLGRELLGHLDAPMTRAELQRAIGTTETELDAELALLNESRILFSEGDRMMSLVTSGVPLDVSDAESTSFAGRAQKSKRLPVVNIA